MKLKKIATVILSGVLLLSAVSLAGCGKSKEKVTVYSSAEDYRIELMKKMLDEKFPDYDITVEYLTTGEHAAKLISEGKNADCDISHDIEYGYAQKIAAAGNYADISGLVDLKQFADDTVVSNYICPEIRNGGAIIINKSVISERGLSMPESYEDLLKPEYKGLISMPNPKSSGTGYMFLKALVNSWGEDKAFEYFDKLSENILAFESSGSGPVNKLIQKEVAIGLGMTAQAVTKINESSADFEIKYFEEGSPFSLYGTAIVNGKETREAVKEVFNYICTDINKEMNKQYYPEKIYKDFTPAINNYPTDIKYSDMSNDTIEEKERLLAKWKY